MCRKLELCAHTHAFAIQNYTHTHTHIFMYIYNMNKAVNIETNLLPLNKLLTYSIKGGKIRKYKMSVKVRESVYSYTYTGTKFKGREKSQMKSLACNSKYQNSFI